MGPRTTVTARAGGGVRLCGGWLPQAVVATGVVMLLGLAVLNPDRFMADRNIDRFERGERLDVTYLRGAVG